MEPTSGAGGVVRAGTAPPVRVYVVDDHELLRRGLRSVLEADPRVQVVGEGSSALEATRRIPALRPDVALLDVRLGDGSGIEVCRAIRSVDPGIRVLMITSYDDEEARTAARLAGASGVVLKQIRGRRLVDALCRVAAGGQVVDEEEPAAPPQQDRDVDDRLASAALTPQERRILDLVVEGLTNRQIGERIGIAEKTVRNHVTSILAKLGFTRRTQAAVYVARRKR